MSLLRHCNTGRTCFPLPQQKNFPTYKRCSENHNNTCPEDRKIRGLKFDTLAWHIVFRVSSPARSTSPNETDATSRRVAYCLVGNATDVLFIGPPVNRSPVLRPCRPNIFASLLTVLMLALLLLYTRPSCLDQSVCPSVRPSVAYGTST